MVKAFMVKYKIKINQNYSHSDYLYQKLFRAIYGYTQVVTKSNGKKYVYHRPGVLSYVPYIKKGKNEVILTKEGFSKLIDYLKTGKNPAHKWQEKGNWTASYSMYDLDISEDQVEKAMVHFIKNIYVLTPDGHNKKLIEVLEDIDKGVIYDDNILKMYLKTINKIQNLEWYNIALKNKFVNKFDILAKQLKQKII